MKIRVVYDSSATPHMRVTDADTGDSIPGVRWVKFFYEEGAVPTFVLEMIPGAVELIVKEGRLVDVTTFDDATERKMLFPEEPGGDTANL